MPISNPLQIVVKESFRYIDFTAVSNALDYRHQRITVAIRNLNEKQIRPLVVFHGAGERNRKMETANGSGYSHRLESICCLPGMHNRDGRLVLSCTFENSANGPLGPFQKSKILCEPKIQKDDLENKVMEIGSEDLLDRDNDDSILRIHIAKSYREVNIEVVQGRNLVAKDRQYGFLGRKTSSDPYVRVRMNGRSDKEKFQQTRVIKKTLNPIWNEALKLKVPLKEPLGALVLQVMDHDNGSLDDPMGAVFIPASDIVEIMGGGVDRPLESYHKWRPVTTGEKGASSYCHNATGELLVSATSRSIDGRSMRKNRASASVGSAPFGISPTAGPVVQVPARYGAADVPAAEPAAAMGVLAAPITCRSFDGIPSMFKPP